MLVMGQLKHIIRLIVHKTYIVPYTLHVKINFTYRTILLKNLGEQHVAKFTILSLFQALYT